VNVAFDRDGSRLASVTSDGLVRVWQFAGGRPSFQHPSAKLVAFDSTGRRLLTMSDDEVKVWDSGGAARTLSAASQIYHAAFSPDGSRIVTASEDGRARIWDAATGAERMSLEHVRRVTHAAFRPDGAWLATASAPGVAGPEVAIWDLRTGDKLFGLPHGTRRPRYVEFTPGGARLLSLGIDGMAVWDLASKQELPRFAELKDVTSAAFSPDGRRLLVRQGRSAARVYDVERQQAAGPEIRHENFMIDYTAFGSDAANILVAGGGWGRMWDPRTGIALTPPLTHGRRSNVTKVAASSDGRLLATIADDGSARLWDARSGRPLSPPVRHGSEVRDVAFAPDASRFATAGGGGARVWSVGGAGAPGDETLAARARVLSAREIDETGAIAALDRQEVMQAWAAAQGQRAKGKGQR
jgi:WD40 repeat protein